MATTYYKTGTASATLGSTAVTGTGTNWKTACREGDLWGAHRGTGIRIAEIASETALTLAYPWTGPTQTSAAYEIQLTSRGVGLFEAIDALVEKIDSGNVEALAGLTGAADRLGYFTGPGTMQITPLTALARSLLDDTTQAQMYQTLGIVPDAQMPARLSESGIQISGDAVEIQTNGYYRLQIGAANSPDTTKTFHIIAVRHGVNISLFAMPRASTGPCYFATTTTSAMSITWTTVGGDAGSNASGSYVRFADGTQICMSANNTFTRETDNSLVCAVAQPAAFVGNRYHAISISNTTADQTPTGLDRRIGIPRYVINSDTIRLTRSDGAAVFASGDNIANVRVVTTGRWY